VRSSEGRLFGWGNRALLGENTSGTATSVPIEIPRGELPLSKARQLCARSSALFVVTVDGEVYSAGTSYSTVLGRSNTTHWQLTKALPTMPTGVSEFVAVPPLPTLSVLVYPTKLLATQLLSAQLLSASAIDVAIPRAPEATTSLMDNVFIALLATPTLQTNA
jgi:hypothetical protein